MKENLKKIKIFTLLYIILINIGCSAQNYQKKQFYDYLDNVIAEKKYLFFEISLMKKCGNEYLFELSKMNYNDNLSDRLKTYNYKDVLIIFDLGDEKDLKALTFFDSYFKEVKTNISNIPRGSQSLIDGRALYFRDKNFIEDRNEIQNFMEKDCK